MSKQKAIFFLLLCTFFVPLTAQEVEEESLVDAEVQVEETVVEHKFTDSIDAINQALLSSQYAQALYHLDTLSAKIREQHAQGIKQFFPTEVGALQSASWKSSAGDVGFDSAQYVAFSAQLADEDDNTIEFHVISEDPSILEYATLVKKPRLVKNLQDTKIVTISDFNALEKANEDSNFLEHNIVISNTLMLNVVINGKIESDVVASFYDALDFQGLLNYIK